MRFFRLIYALRLMRLHLRYKVRVGVGGDGKTWPSSSASSIGNCRFGGSRPYLICPGPGDGTDCADGE